MRRALRLPDHPQRLELNDEVHARPPMPLQAPANVSYLALLTDASAVRVGGPAQSVAALAQRFDLPPPVPGTNHYSAEFGRFRLRWEQHTEFSRYMFLAPSGDAEPFTQTALRHVPEDWLDTLSGQVIVAAHGVLAPPEENRLDVDAISTHYFDAQPLIGAVIGGGTATALTDFRIQRDGFSRFWLMDHGMSPGQAGRMMQRLLEIETYRVLALLALPLARRLAPLLSANDQELARITTALAQGDALDEPALLNRLTQLEAEIESRESESHYRFGAAVAYYELVRRRIEELREERIKGLQTFSEFTERRLAPAMNTCVAAARRQDSLSQRVARATQLLSTRVDITHEKQNQKILESMNRRAALQLRLQQTVEGLSIAAGTYYIVGLVGFVAKGFNALHVPVQAELAMAASVPFVLVVLVLGMRRIRRGMSDGAR
jgi:uncharacterized membrane-anchored protein